MVVEWSMDLFEKLLIPFLENWMKWKRTFNRLQYPHLFDTYLRSPIFGHVRNTQPSKAFSCRSSSKVDRHLSIESEN